MSLEYILKISPVGERLRGGFKGSPARRRSALVRYRGETLGAGWSVDRCTKTDSGGLRASSRRVGASRDRTADAPMAIMDRNLTSIAVGWGMEEKSILVHTGIFIDRPGEAGWKRTLKSWKGVDCGGSLHQPR